MQSTVLLPFNFNLVIILQMHGATPLCVQALRVFTAMVALVVLFTGIQQEAYAYQNLPPCEARLSMESSSHAARLRAASNFNKILQRNPEDMSPFIR